MGQEAGRIMDLAKWAEPVRWLGPGAEGDTEYALQDGVIYAWSESNIRYESAWWLNPDGSVATSDEIGMQRKIAEVAAHRPFSPEWLNS